ncbi:MAG TPA: sigma-70 family RNA polymerase sigma factor [Anaeromyxobacteraceae bacterium]|nr:sigma-70 family RNA polymerase sigma factor [Anaeromyxobacteraceae bacterium]
MTGTPPIASPEPDASRPAARDDGALLEALRQGDERAFLALVDRYQAAMLRVARAYVSAAAAEDVAQEAWLGVVRGAERFEGRSSVKTWLFRIVVYCARTRRARDGRSVPLSALEAEGGEDDAGPAVDPDRFLDVASRYPGHWASPPQPFAEERLISAEAARRVREEIERLPPSQRAVITLRDVEGLEAREACDLLGLTEANQRVLLHRARSRVRAALERHLGEEGRP